MGRQDNFMSALVTAWFCPEAIRGERSRFVGELSMFHGSGEVPLHLYRERKVAVRSRLAQDSPTKNAERHSSLGQQRRYT